MAVAAAGWAPARGRSVGACKAEAMTAVAATLPRSSSGSSGSAYGTWSCCGGYDGSGACGACCWGSFDVSWNACFASSSIFSTRCITWINPGFGCSEETTIALTWIWLSASAIVLAFPEIYWIVKSNCCKNSSHPACFLESSSCDWRNNRGCGRSVTQKIPPQKTTPLLEC